MDNLVELIIFIIFIVLSMIGGLTKDKKKKKQGTKRPQRKEPVKQKTGTIFDEIFIENKKEETPVYYGEEEKTEVQTTWEPEASYKETFPSKEKSYIQEPPLKIQEAYLTKMEEIGDESRELITYNELISTHRSSRKSEKTKRFSKLLMNPVNLKDYIVISEILGKPKALRR